MGCKQMKGQKAISIHNFNSAGEHTVGTILSLSAGGGEIDYFLERYWILITEFVIYLLSLMKVFKKFHLFIQGNYFYCKKKLLC